MANSLEIGSWSWSDRWRYSDEAEFGPTQQRPDRIIPNVKPGEPIPEIRPHQRKFEHDLEESEYTNKYGPSPEVKEVDRKFRPGGDPSQKVRGRGHGQKPEFDQAEHSAKLWGRHNPQHCVNPYVTESQRQYIDHAAEDKDPTDVSNRMKVYRKDYKEAIAKARNVVLDQKV